MTLLRDLAGSSVLGRQRWVIEDDKIKAPPSVGVGMVVKRLSEQGFCGSTATAV